MLESLQKIAVALRPLYIPALVGVVVFAVLFLMNIFELEPAADTALLIPILVGLLWSLFWYSFIGSFQEIPGKPQAGQRFFTRIKIRCIRAWYWLLALLTLATSVGVIVVSIRLLSVLE